MTKASLAGYRFRRLLVRWEKRDDTDLAMVHPALGIIATPGLRWMRRRAQYSCSKAAPARVPPLAPTSASSVMLRVASMRSTPWGSPARVPWRAPR